MCRFGHAEGELAWCVGVAGSAGQWRVRGSAEASALNSVVGAEESAQAGVVADDPDGDGAGTAMIMAGMRNGQHPPDLVRGSQMRLGLVTDVPLRRQPIRQTAWCPPTAAKKSRKSARHDLMAATVLRRSPRWRTKKPDISRTPGAARSLNTHSVQVAKDRLAALPLATTVAAALPRPRHEAR